MQTRQNQARIWLAALAAVAGMALWPAPLRAYNPPVDTAGPLTATIDGPAEVTETGVPQPVSVVLENRGDRPLHGTVRLSLVDHWTAEPAEAPPFTVDAKSTTRCSFTITAGKGTYSAHYPIHAYVDFEADGQKQQAHPILVFETKLPARPPVVPGPEKQHRLGPLVLGRADVGLRHAARRAPFPPQNDHGSRSLGTLAGKGGPCEVRLWPGQRGLLDTVVGFRRNDQRLYFRGFEVRVLGVRIDDARSPIRLLEAAEETASGKAGGYQVRHRFESQTGTFDLVGRLYVQGAALRAEFRLENAPKPQPWRVVTLEDVAAGPWSRQVEQVYAGDGNVIRRPEAFELGFEGHRLSTSFVGFDFDGGPSLVQGVDVPPRDLEVRPDRRHYSLHTPHASRWAFIPADNVWDAVKSWRELNGLHAAGGVRKAAGRFVFDLWGGRYAESTEQLRRAFRYGLTDAMVIWHNWQRWGYDYRLPNICPPNPTWGTLEEMQDLVATCKKAGVPIAVHDNYIDFYPDADGFSYDENIAFHPNGTPVKAWLNEGRNARSYRYRADRVEPFLRRNLALVRDGLAPSAYFIDVWSSIRPYDFWTADGRFFDCASTRDSWRKHFAWIRDFLGGDAPQISESGHDQLIGWLDGAQTNHLRVGKPVPGDRYGWAVWRIDCQDAERTCWFDAAHHDRFVLHGSGYSVRYQAGLDARMHGIYSDDYLATEVLTGHPAMVSGPFGRDVVRVYWLTGELMRALALGTIDKVDYVGGDLHRQHVQWRGGGQVWVNRGTSDWTIAAINKTLPQYGFAAVVPTEAGPVEATLERLGDDGLIVETARSPQFLYFNGRQPLDPLLPISLAVEKVEYLGRRQIRLVLRWEAKTPIPPGYRPFLHFCDAQGEIVFQAINRWDEADASSAGVIAATAEASVPPDCSPGQDYELRFGFYNPAGGPRLPLAGPDDGQQRIRLGSILLASEASSPKELSGVTWKPLGPQENPWLARQNSDGKPIDFGPVVTSGGCRLAREGDALVVTPLPCEKGPEFAVRIHPAALPWPLPEPRVVAAVGEDGGVLDRKPVRREGNAVVLDCRPGVFSYRLEPK